MTAPRYQTWIPRALLLLVGIAISGCIVVVEENDFRRNHGLHGTSWTLEFIWVHGHSYRAQEASYGISFSSAEEMTGTAGCASFTADYDVDDESIRINRFRTSTFGCDEDEVRTLFLEYLPAASDLTMTDQTLELEAGEGVQLVFGR